MRRFVFIILPFSFVAVAKAQSNWLTINDVFNADATLPPSTKYPSILFGDC